MRYGLRRWSWSVAAVALAAVAVTAAWSSTGSGAPSDLSAGAGAEAPAALRADRLLVNDALEDPVDPESGRRGWRVATPGAQLETPVPTADGRAWLGVRARGAPGTAVVLRAADERFRFPAGPAGTMAVVGPLRAPGGAVTVIGPFRTADGGVTVERVVGGTVEIGSAALSPDGVVALPAAGFYAIEDIESPPFAWMGRRGDVAIAAADGTRRTRVSFEVESLAPRTVRLRVSTSESSIGTRVRSGERRRIVRVVPLVRGRAVIQLASDWPGISPPKDSRRLTFRISNLDAAPAR